MSRSSVRRYLDSLGVTAMAKSARRAKQKLGRKKEIDAYMINHQIRKLQIGSGGNLIEGWLNTDLNPGARAIFLDATETFPFENNTFDYVLSVHMIEHVDYQSGLSMLKESYRILRSGGRIRVATPDFRFLVRLYQKDRNDFEKQYIDWVSTWEPHTWWPSNGRELFVINNFVRAWGHTFIYDHQVLSDAMLSVGFTEIESCAVGESTDPNLSGLEFIGRTGTVVEFKKLETLVLEGRKCPDG